MGWNTFVESAQRYTALIRDIGLILGIPTVGLIAHYLYRARIRALEAQLRLAEASSYDKSLSKIRAQKELFELELTEMEQALQSLQASEYEKQIEVEKLELRIERLTSQIKELETSIYIYDLYSSRSYDE